MLQIISNTNETATGPELVQNGSFSELGTDVVLNGGFSELGTDVITNGSFSGVTELITNGDFATDTDWTKGTGWTISGGVANSDGTNSAITQIVMTAETSVKITVTVTGSPSLLVFGLSSFYGTLSERTLLNGTNTYYLTTKSTAFSITNAGADVCTIANVSVKEAGEDWTAGLGWTYGDSKAISTQALGSQLVLNPDFTDGVEGVVGGNFESGLIGTVANTSGGAVYSWALNTISPISGTQDGLLAITSVGTVTHYPRLGFDGGLEVDKSYVLTFDYKTNSGTCSFKSINRGGGSSDVFPTAVTLTGSGTYTYYFQGFGTANLTLNLDGTNLFETQFDNVSIKELGGDWTGLDGNLDTYDENGVTITSITGGGNNRLYQSNVTEDGKPYKVTYTIYTTSYSAGTILKYYDGNSYEAFPEQGIGTHTFYYTREGTNDSWYFSLSSSSSGSTTDFVTISSISVQEIATSYLTQSTSLSAKTWKIIYSVSDFLAGSVSATEWGTAKTANEVGITEYVEIGSTSDFRMVNIDGYFEGSVSDISAQETDPNSRWTTYTTLDGEATIGSGGARIKNGGSAGNAAWIQANVFEVGKTYKVSYRIVSNVNTNTLELQGYGAIATTEATHTMYVFGVVTRESLYFKRTGANTDIVFTDVSVQELDPNDYWNMGTGWSLEVGKAISTVTGSNSDITQSILTAGKTYRTVFKVVDYTAGTAQAVVTGDEGTDRTAIETYTEDLTTTGTDFSIRSKVGTFDGSVSSVSAKLLGSYSDQSMYITAADVQTIAQASVYYLVELISQGSKNSLYFLPSSVVANNGRYTKLNFTVVSKDALTQPTVGIISFYDAVGGFDTYPMGFYEFKIYEQTSSTNLDPTLATGLLEKGFAFVRDFSGNMQELTDGYKEYNPTLTQYVYSK